MSRRFAKILLLLVFCIGIARAAAGDEKTVTARRTSHPIVMDGLADEADWALAEAASDFVQSEPLEGQPATDRTEVRVLFDQNNLYFGIYCYQASDKIIIYDLKRDFSSDFSDSLGIVIDPLHDHRNGFVFFVNPGSAKSEFQYSGDGRESNRNWEAVWHAVSKIRSDGWSIEIAIPFRSLGFTSRSDPAMGINFRRVVRHKNEWSYWSLVPRRFRIGRVSLAGILAGLDAVRAGRNFRVKPFGITTLTQRKAPGHDTARFDADAGVDYKHRITQGLTLDLTYNTDFSQVEVDTQQINLTRFSLFFPEKRDFFLENTALFELGDIPAAPGNRNPADEETQLLYSRRIGLSAAGTSLPLLGGARLSGQAGQFAIGLLNIEQQASEGIPSNNFTVARLRRNVFARSDVGAVFINRQGGKPGDYNRAYGIDANIFLTQKLMVNSYWAGTSSPARTGNNSIRKVSARWDSGFTHARLHFADIGENFDPEVGFVLRKGVRVYQLDTGLRPRPRGNGYVREFHPYLTARYWTDRHNTTLTKKINYGAEVLFKDGSKAEISYNPDFERLQAPSKIQNVLIPAGDYFFNDLTLEYSSNNTRLFSGSTRLSWGDFYDGTKTSAYFSGVLLLKPRLSTQATYERNLVDIKAGRFRADLYTMRSNYSFNPRMFIDAFVQYNASTRRLLTNVRFNLEHRPLSNISVVLVEDRLARVGQDTARAIIVKYTHMLQF